MTANHPFIDDPRLSAYALGEMTAIEAAAFAKEIADCPEALTEVAEIKACVESLTKAFAAEPMPVFTRIELPMTAPTTPNALPARKSRRSAMLLVALSSSAMLVIGVIFYTFASNEGIVAKYEADNLPHAKAMAQRRSAQDAASAERAFEVETQPVLTSSDGHSFGDVAAPSSEMSLASRGERSGEEGTYIVNNGSSNRLLNKVDSNQVASTIVGEATLANNNEVNGGANGNQVVNEYLGREKSARPSTGNMGGMGGGIGPTAGRGGTAGRPLEGRPTDDWSSLARRRQTYERKPSRNDAIEDELPRLIVEKEESLISNNGANGNGIEMPSGELQSRGRYILPESKLFEEAEAVSRVKTDSAQIATSEKKPGTNAHLEQLAEGASWHLGYRVRNEEEARQLSRERESARNETYAPLIENNFLAPRNYPLSTLGLDVDTASYSNTRRFLQQNTLPPPDAVRIEELVNYFNYNDPQPTEHPLNVSVAYAACPWAPKHKLVRIGLKGKEIAKSERPISNLVFLIDVSGSMQDANKLPLVQVALQMLAEELGEKDHISIVTYSNEAKLLLPPTSGHQRSEIQSAIAKLHAGGSTNGAAGIQLAYETAALNLLKEGSNRVILCTDGDFNVGITDDDQLVTFLKEQTSAGIFLSIFGFGMGNLKDAKLEKLADRGNGHYGYIDSTHEARKVFVEELTSTLYTIAKDVKLQVEFNPSRVAEYRLIGYENRLMPAQDFNDDTKDGGDLGAGHSVVAMYEIVPIGVSRQAPVVDDLKYQPVPQKEESTDEKIPPTNLSNEWLTVKVRYQLPTTDVNVQPQSVKLEFPLKDEQNVESLSEIQRADFLWSASVTMYGLLLRNSNYRGQSNYDAVLEMASAAKRDDSTGRKAEFLELVNRAKLLAK